MTFPGVLKFLLPLLIACSPVVAKTQLPSPDRTIKFAALAQGITSLALDDDRIITLVSTKKQPAVRFRKNTATGGLYISFHPDMPLPHLPRGYLITACGHVIRYEFWPEQSDLRIRDILFSSGTNQPPTSAAGEKK